MKLDTKTVRRRLKELLNVERVSFSDPLNGNLFSSFEKDYNTHTYCFIIEEDEKIIAYCVFCHVVDEGEIINIAVLPEYRGTGVAISLYREVETYARKQDVASIYLEVRESNDSAIKFYKKMGFLVVGKRKNYYTFPSENALVMKKNWRNNESQRDM